MPEPPAEYTTALNNLKALRGKIFNDLVGGRVKASLDAQHESMQKYASVMENLGVTPYLMGYIRHMVVALGFKGQHIGGGALRDVRADYIGDETDYPMSAPYSVPQRMLPQVDVFQFAPVYDVDLLDKTNLSSLQSALLIQAPSGTFRDAPDVENAQYDYYTVYPNQKRKNDWSVAGAFEPFNFINKISGENVRCIRELIKADTYEHYWYILVVWLDATLCIDSKLDQPFAVACAGTSSVNAPEVYFSVVGQRFRSIEGGIRGSWKYSDALRGFIRLSTGTEELEPIEVVWKNTFKLTVQVNDPARGHTVPAVGEYSYEATMGVGVTAYPHAGYEFDHWERNGAPCGTDVLYSIQMYKDYTLKAFFVPV